MRWISGASIAAVAILACAAAAQAQTGWLTFHNQPFAISIETPGDPRVTQSTTATSSGSAPTLAGVIDLGDRGALLFTVGDFSALNNSPDPNVVLEGSVKGSVEAAHAILDSEQSVTVLGQPGRDIVVHSDQFRGRERIVYTHHRLYAVIGVGPASTGVPVEYDRFMSSLAFDH